MQLVLKSCFYDDYGNECKEGDTILIQTKDMEEPLIAILRQINTLSFLVTFDEILSGYRDRQLRPSDVILCEKHG